MVSPDFFQRAAYDNRVPKKGGEYHEKDVLDLFVGFWAYS
jgi:hypothetical protein